MVRRGLMSKNQKFHNLQTHNYAILGQKETSFFRRTKVMLCSRAIQGEAPPDPSRKVNIFYEKFKQKTMVT